MAIIDQNYIEELKLKFEKLSQKVLLDAENYEKTNKQMTAKYDGLKQEFLKLDELQQKCLSYIETMIQASDFTKTKIWPDDQTKPNILLTPDDLKKIRDIRSGNRRIEPTN